MTEQLDRGLIDFGTLIEPIDLRKYDSLHLPRPDIWGVLMRKDHPLSRLSRIRPEDLRPIPLICSRQMTGEDGLSGWAMTRRNCISWPPAIWSTLWCRP